MDDEEYEETQEVISGVDLGHNVGINAADIARSLLMPLQGYLAGTHNMVQQWMSLLTLQSAAIDERKEQKRFAREAQAEIERII